MQAILTTHYLPRDAEVASNAIAKLNQYKAQKVDEKLPTGPTAQKSRHRKRENLNKINWLGQEELNLRMAESKSAQFPKHIKEHFEKSSNPPLVRSIGYRHFRNVGA